MTISGKLFTVASCALLAGCTWFGKDKPTVEGTRIAVTASAPAIAADPDAARVPMTLAQPMANTAWPVQGGVPSHAAQHLALSGNPLKKVWDADIGSGNDDGRFALSQPVVVGNTMAVLDAESTLTLLDTKTGKPFWEKSLQPDYEDEAIVSGGVAHGGETLYVATGYGELVALNSKDGSSRWKVTLPAPARSAPTIRDGRLYVITVSNELLAYNMADGQLLWNHAGLNETASLLGGASPAVNAEMVIAAYSSGEITALRPDNGRVLWFDSLSGAPSGGLTTVATLADIAGSPVLDNDLVFAASNSGQFVAIESRTGQRRWTQSIASYTTPWVSGNTVYFISDENQLLCLTREGLVRWTLPLARYENPKSRKNPVTWTSPVLAGNRLWMASSAGALLAVDAVTGKTVQQEELDEPVLVSPVVAGNILYLLDNDGELSAWQ